MRSSSFVPAIALLLALSACTGTPPTADTNKGDASSQTTSAAKPPFKFIAYTDPSPTPGTDVRIIEMEVKDFAFIPSAITLTKGEKVAVKLTSTDGEHSFMASDLGVNVKVAEGETVYVTLPTDQTGTFQFRCGVPCGPGHMDMVGTIVIE